MNFKDLLKNDVGVFLNPDEFAKTVIYNGTEILCLPDIGQENATGNTFSNDAMSDRAVFSVATSDVPSPKSKDKIEYQGKVWHVARLLSSDDTMHKVECISRETPIRR